MSRRGGARAAHRVAALLCLAAFSLSWCEDAIAATRYVDSAAGVDAGAGSSGAPWRTIAYANGHILANETCILAWNATTYDAAISPQVDGTTWQSADTSMNVNTMARVPGISATGKFTTVNSINVRGSVDLNAKYVQLRNCSIEAGLFVWSTADIMIHNRIGTDETTCQWYIQPSNPAVSGDSMRIVGNFGRQRLLGDPSVPAEPHLIHWQCIPGRSASAPTAADSNSMKDWYVANNRDTVTITHGQKFAKVVFLSRLLRPLHQDNLIEVRDSSGIAWGTQTIVIRDSVKRAVCLRDTFDFVAVDPVSQCSHMLCYSPGNQNCNDSLNSFRFCLFRSNVTPSSNDPASFWQSWRFGSRDSACRNVYLCNTDGDCVKIDGAGVGQDTAFFERNTIVQLGAGRALKIEDDAQGSNSHCDPSDPWQGNLRALGNLVVSNSNETVYILTKPGGPGSLTSDYSVVWGPHAGRPYAIKFATCVQAPQLMSTPLVYWTGEEQHGAWGSPMFVDSSFATFNGNLRAGSAAIGAGPWGQDAGAFDYVAAPRQIGDLRSAGATSSQVTLLFTAPGAVGGTGTASSYDVRCSTSPINDGNFTSAPAFSCSCSPSAAGALEVVRVTGLAPSTTYYFAVRASNGSFWSLTSNGAHETTWHANSIEP